MKNAFHDFSDADMRRRRLIWRRGLVALLAVSVLCIGWVLWRVPADIEARTAKALAMAGLDSRVRLRVDGRTVTLDGEVQDAFARARSKAVAESVRGVREVVDRLEAVPVEPPKPPAYAPPPIPPALSPAPPAPSPAIAADPQPREGPEEKPARVQTAAEPLPPAASAPMEIPALHFFFDSTRLTPESEAAFPRIIAALKARPEARLALTGHADSRGPRSYNQRLSLRRAEEVARRLIAAGIEAGRLQARGRGEDHPLANNTTRRGRAMNRRVELTAN